MLFNPDRVFGEHLDMRCTYDAAKFLCYAAAQVPTVFCGHNH